jgi:hypothetical protein
MQMVDPLGDFGTGLFPVISGDARRDKMRLFEERTADRSAASGGPVEGLVLGSSRSFKIDPSELQRQTGLRFFNFAVEVARAEDDLAIYRWVRSHGVLPKILIVGLDVEGLHDDDQIQDRLRRNWALRQQIPEISPPPATPLAKLAESAALRKSLFTIGYAKEMLLSVRLALVPTPRAVSFEADGTSKTATVDAQIQAGTYPLADQLRTCLPTYLGIYRSMHGLSAQREATLRELVREATGDGVDVRVWITGVHPDAIPYFSQRSEYPAFVDATWAYLGQLRSEYGIHAYNFSDPAAYGAIRDGFHDCAHVDSRNGALIARTIAQDIGRGR